MKIKKNIGTVDRVGRIAVGLALLFLVPLGLVNPESEWAYFGLLGIVPLVAGIFGYCPPYALLGINTNKGNRECLQEVHDEYAEPESSY